MKLIGGGSVINGAYPVKFFVFTNNPGNFINQISIHIFNNNTKYICMYISPNFGNII